MRTEEKTSGRAPAAARATGARAVVPEVDNGSSGTRGALRLSPTTAVGPARAELEPEGPARPVLVAAPAPRERIHQEHPAAAHRGARAGARPGHLRGAAARLGDLAAQDSVRGREGEAEATRRVYQGVGDEFADEELRRVALFREPPALQPPPDLRAGLGRRDGTGSYTTLEWPAPNGGWGYQPYAASGSGRCPPESSSMSKGSAPRGSSTRGGLPEHLPENMRSHRLWGRGMRVPSPYGA